MNKIRDNNGEAGLLVRNDLANYAIKERPAICAKFRSYDVCGMGPPSSGAIGVGQILGMINIYPVVKMRNPQTLRLIGDATRLAFADRGRYVADSDFVNVPTKELVAEKYLLNRASLLNRSNAIPHITAGEPIASLSNRWAPDSSIEKHSTTHVSIIDSYGNALSLTSSIENAFGSRLMTNGFLLNNQLTDFSFKSSANGVPIANRVEEVSGHALQWRLQSFSRMENLFWSLGPLVVPELSLCNKYNHCYFGLWDWTYKQQCLSLMQ